jgi:hypothetical protein
MEVGVNINVYIAHASCEGLVLVVSAMSLLRFVRFGAIRDKV